MVGREENARAADIQSPAIAGKDFRTLIQRFIADLALDREAAGTTPFRVAHLRNLKAPAQSHRSFGHNYTTPIFKLTQYLRIYPS